MQRNNDARIAGESSAYELPFKTKSGEVKWGIISGAPNYDIHGNQIVETSLIELIELIKAVLQGP